MIWGNNPLRANADGFFGHWDHRLHAPRVELVRGRPAGDVAFGPCQALHPGASRHGRRAGPGHRARDDRRGPLRPRLRRVLVLRLRRVPGARQGMDARARRRDLLVPGREDLRGRAPYRHRRRHHAAMGRRVRPDQVGKRHGARGRGRAGAHRQHRQSRRLRGHQFRLRAVRHPRERVEGASQRARGASGRRRQLGPHERGRQGRPRHPAKPSSTPARPRSPTP